MGTEIRIPRVQPYGSVSGPRADWLYVCDPSARQVVTSIGVANRTIYVRRVTPAVPISQIEFLVGVQSGNMCLAAYAHDAANNRPGAQLATTGSFAVPSSGDRSQSLGATVTPEWISIAVDNSTATFSAAFGLGLSAWLGGAGRVNYQDAAFPSPNPAVPIGAAMGGIFMLVGKP